MLMHAVAPWLSAHDVISRERLPQMCDNTDIVRSAPIFRNFPNSAGLHDVHEIFFVPFIIHLVYNEPTQLQSSDSKNPILAVDEQRWKCEVRLSLSLSLNTRWKITFIQ